MTYVSAREQSTTLGLHLLLASVGPAQGGWETAFWIFKLQQEALEQMLRVLDAEERLPRIEIL